MLDRWVRSRLHGTVAAVTDALDGFDALRGAQALERFVDDLSNWYVRRSRSRFWQADDATAHATLHECLSTLALLLAPFTPFVADELHRNLARHRRVGAPGRLAGRRRVGARRGARSRDGAGRGRSCRSGCRPGTRRSSRCASRCGARWCSCPTASTFSDAVTAEVADALNVKQLETVTDLEGLLDVRGASRTSAPSGRRSAKQMPLVKDALAPVDGAAVQRALDADGGYDLALPTARTVRLDPDDVEVRAESHAELALAQDAGYAVAIDTTVDDELRAEGIARDLIRLLNDQRKADGFEIADRIRVRLGATGRVEAAAHLHRDRIAREVLAVEFDVVTSPTPTRRASKLDGETVSRAARAGRA